MKALILNGAEEALDPVIHAAAGQLAARGCETSEARLRDVEIAGCLGCYRCWVATPGVCTINDPGRALAAVLIRSDVALFVTPVVFGGYSYDLKKALDRAVPLVLPFFTKVDGEVHHQKRYDKYPRIVAVGIARDGDGEDARLFRQLVARNAINFHSPAWACAVVAADWAGNRIAAAIGTALDEAGVRK